MLLLRGTALVFLNGLVLGVVRRPLAFVSAVRRLRRSAMIGEFVSIHAHGDSVNIATDGGRVCRPLIICDNGVPRVTNEHLAKVCSTSKSRAGLQHAVLTMPQCAPALLRPCVSDKLEREVLELSVLAAVGDELCGYTGLPIWLIQH